MPRTEMKTRETSTTHKPGEWLFREYIGLLGMYLKSTPVPFDPDEIKKINITKKGDEYQMKAHGNNEYIVNVGIEDVVIEVKSKNETVYHEKI